MSQVIDGVLKEWGDRLHYKKLKGRKAKRMPFGKKVQAAGAARTTTTAKSARATLSRTVRKAPEVMVKISGGGKCMKAIKAHMDYISRNGEVALEDENGKVIQGKEAVRDLRDDWQEGHAGKPIPYDDDQATRREAFNIVLSMPPGTDREAVRQAAKEFAAANFGNHQYVFAAHDDEKHPHVHLCVKAMDKDMVRLNPRKADLQQWRESFAEKLRENGIEANATPRQWRGKAHKGEKQAIRHIDQDKQRKKPSWAKEAQRKAIAEVVKRKRADEAHPAEAALKKQRDRVVKAYAEVAGPLSKSTNADDRQLALQIVALVRDMPPPKTAHRLAVEQERQQTPAGGGRVVEPPRPVPGRNSER